MSAIITFGSTRATLADDVWNCANKRIEANLNAISGLEDESASSPDPEESKARRVAAIFGGEFVSSDFVPLPLDPDAVY